MQVEKNQSRLFEITLAVLISTLLIVNVIGTRLFTLPGYGNDSMLILYAGGAGFIFGQVALLAMWGVLGGESVVHRFPRSAGLCIAIFLSWVAGTHLADEPLPVDVAFVMSLFGLLAFSILSAPLWFIGSTWPMRIWHPRQIEDHRFSIGTLLVWTTAVALGVAVGTHLFQNDLRFAGFPPRAMFMRMIPMVAGIGIFIIALAVPLLWAVMAPKFKALVWVVIGMVFLLGPPILLGLIVAWSGSRMSASDLMTSLIAWYAFYAVMSIVVVGCLLLVRAFGFRYTTPHFQQEVLLSPFGDGETAKPD